MKLALGTVQFGLQYGVANQTGRVSFEEARSIVRAAERAGIDTLDTAIAYGDSEQRLGEIGVSRWRVVSKLPAGMPSTADASTIVATAVRESLHRLKTSRLYGLLLHRADELLRDGGERLYAALAHVKREGLVEKIGISIYDPTELDLLYARYRFDLVQAPFSILDRRLLHTGWLGRLAAGGTEVHVRSVFLQGLLLMPSGRRPPAFARWAPLWAAFDAWLNDAQLTPLEACLRYALSVPEISRVVIGVDHAAQLAECLHAAAGPSVEIPDTFRTDDLDLVNPSRWTAFA